MLRCHTGMLNHGPGSGNATWGMSEKRNGFLIKATADIAKGEAITLNYGECVIHHAGCSGISLSFCLASPQLRAPRQEVQLPVSVELRIRHGQQRGE